jgi:hypothetical protein
VIAGIVFLVNLRTFLEDGSYVYFCSGVVGTVSVTTLVWMLTAAGVRVSERNREYSNVTLTEQEIVITRYKGEYLFKRTDNFGVMLEAVRVPFRDLIRAGFRKSDNAIILECTARKFYDRLERLIYDIVQVKGRTSNTEAAVFREPYYESYSVSGVVKEVVIPQEFSEETETGLLDEICTAKYNYDIKQQKDIAEEKRIEQVRKLIPKPRKKTEQEKKLDVLKVLAGFTSRK